jgi:hypothetical protein
MRLIHVVPQLPPVLGGVGSYALALARCLRDKAGIESLFLVADPLWPGGEAQEPGLAARRLERQAGTLCRRLEEGAAGTAEAAAVLLHYANYGYQHRGCPVWLERGMRLWRASTAGSRRRLVTFFHEVYASGSPWHSSFWLSPLQRRLAARLARLSDSSATSLVLYAGLVERLVPGTGALVLPVLSPLGEPAAPPPLADRQPRRMVLFGGTGARRRALAESRDDLAAACRTLGIEEVLDIGPPLSGALPDAIGGVPLRSLGPLADGEASACLLAAFAGFVAYPPAFFGKSTVFAAYCAHGLLPVCAGGGARPSPGGLAWSPGAPAGPAELQGVADAARTWYMRHSAAHLAASFRTLLGA